ncbi:hypothetical protein GCM10023231_04520 [Olivibacter ginsenosidimutans]|uniref:Putative mRNA interferase YoeB n=1 Tax=Olivibacter ginsenosidimutans TaxID=1176537 RepID=A0ABP9AFK3_9SPHI
MSYRVELSLLALEHIRFHKKAGNKSLLKKLERLLDELETHPYEGIGQPELLKYDYAGYWSRRIDHKHRLIYQVNDETIAVNVVSAKGHYRDR